MPKINTCVMLREPIQWHLHEMENTYNSQLVTMQGRLRFWNHCRLKRLPLREKIFNKEETFTIPIHVIPLSDNFFLVIPVRLFSDNKCAPTQYYEYYRRQTICWNILSWVRVLFIGCEYFITSKHRNADSVIKQTQHAKVQEHNNTHIIVCSSCRAFGVC